MEHIKAFIGHSFNENDKEVINRFLNFFDSLKDTIGFEWDHAEKAESKALSKKVQDKMEGKNLFIGIFTKKDYKIRSNKLKNFIKWKYSQQSEFQASTSEWIIQESGYGLANCGRVLFLIEEGANISAGLQGDVELIFFSRENPELCFTKFIEVIGSISPYKTKEPVSEKKAMPPEDTEKEEDAEIKEESRRTKFLKCYRSLYNLIVEENDYSKAETELNNIITKFEGDEALNDIYWKSRFQVFRCKTGESDGFTELIKLSESHPDSTFPFLSLAEVYEQYENYDEAANQYLQASEVQKDKNIKINYVKLASISYATDGNFSKAYSILLEQFNESDLDTSNLHDLYEGLAGVAKIEKNDVLYTAFAEKALEYTPTDSDIRFSLAYRYSNIDEQAFALYHYKILCDHHGNGGNWNNIGACYNELKMNYKSVSSYIRAKDEYSETLAIANLAYKYIKEGFLEQAEAILNSARKKENYHSNVDSAISNINMVKKEEDKLETEVLSKVDENKKFRCKFAQAYTLPSNVNIRGEWKSKHGNIQIAIEKDKLIGSFEISIPETQNVLTRSAGLLNALGQPQFKKKSLRLNGNIHNRAIIYKLSIYTEPANASILGLGNTKFHKEGMMIISEDSSTVYVMENEEDKKEFSFYEMKKVSKDNEI